MVTLTPEAIEKIDRYIASSQEEMDWFLVISWRRGTADNRRASDGSVTWEKGPDEGWVADLGGFIPGRVPPDTGAPLHGGVRLLVQEQPQAPESFPGGEVYVELDQFKVRLLQSRKDD